MNTKSFRQTNVFVVDSEDLSRAGMCLLLSKDERVNVVGSGVTLEEANADIQRAQPDVLIVKGLANAEHIVDPIKKLRLQCPGVTVLALIELITPEVVGALMRTSNVLGIFSARSDIASILRGIDAITGGCMCFDTRISDVLRDIVARAPMQPETSMPRSSSIASSLTEREGEILRCVARGMTNQQIAAELRISVETVKTYIRRIMDKSSIRSRSQLLNCVPEWKTNSDRT